MPKGIARPVHAGPLAIPHAKHAVVLRFGFELCHLGAPDGGGGKLFVYAADELHIRGIEHALVLGNNRFDATEWRAAVSPLTNVAVDRPFALSTRY